MSRPQSAGPPGTGAALALCHPHGGTEGGTCSWQRLAELRKESPGETLPEGEIWNKGWGRTLQLSRSATVLPRIWLHPFSTTQCRSEPPEPEVLIAREADPPASSLPGAGAPWARPVPPLPAGTGPLVPDGRCSWLHPASLKP